MPSKALSILIINPNSTLSMTEALKPIVADLQAVPTETAIHYFTAPTGPASINDSDSAIASASHSLPHLLPLLLEHDGVLVACYSDHPLVAILKEHTRKPVTGIFESSVTASLLLIRKGQKFGIVSTGKIWEDLLTTAVQRLLGESSLWFSGVATTGLNATDLHDTPATEVKKRMKDATKTLIESGEIGAICLGCAGMAGMEEMVREACIETLGEEKGQDIRIVDGVKAGLVFLEGLLRCEF